MGAIFEATATEAVTFEVDKTGQLPDGVTLAASGSTATVYDVFGRDVTSALLSSSSVSTTPASDTARFAKKVGATTQPLGEYRVVMSLVLSSGGPIEDVSLLYIRDRTAA